MKTSLFTKTKRILSLVLCLCLVWTMVPGQTMGVYAVEGNAVAWQDVNGNGILDDGEAAFTSISAALTAGGTIRLIRDVNTEEVISMNSGTVILDLNGHSIEYEYVKFDGIEHAAFSISGTADLTIIDSQGGGKVYYYKNNAGRSRIYLADSAMLTFAGGTMYTYVEETANYYDLTVSATGASQFRVTGGTVTTKSLFAYVDLENYIITEVGENSWTVTARTVSDAAAWQDTDDDGVIDDDEQVFNDIHQAMAAGGNLKLNQNCEWAGTADNRLNVTQDTILDLNGFTYTVTGRNCAIYIMSGKLTIRDSRGGGSVKGYEGLDSIFVQTGGRCQIEGGTIYGTFAANPGQITLTGGKYNFDPSAYTAAGYAAVAGNDGLWEVIAIGDDSCTVTLNHSSVKANGTYTLQAAVSPAAMQSKPVTYTLKNAGTTGAVLKNQDLTVPYGGTVTVSVTVDGTYTKDFDIHVIQTAVTGISGSLPDTADMGVLNLPAAVEPSNATYNQIEWSVVEGSAEFSSGIVILKSSGKVVLRATVKNGLGNGQDYTKDYTITVNTVESLSVADGVITIEQAGSEHKVTYGNGLSVSYPLDQTIAITGTTTSNRILVKSGSPKLLLNDVSIIQNSYPAMAIETGASVTLTLTGTNTLRGYGGIGVPEGASLTIGGTGSLTAESDYQNYAGIGNQYGSSCGTVTIISGSVTAKGGSYAAGIGGGDKGNGGNITISGGTVTATGGKSGAGIGGGDDGNGGTITISGGVVKATGTGDNYYGGAGIGGGCGAPGGTINISGGTITAQSGTQAAGIGGGSSDNTSGSCSDGGIITITGGSITAKGGSYGAGIGGGISGKSGTITIEGGVITATGGERGAGIGNGNGSLTSDTITIRGGSIIATAGKNAAGIGGGGGGSTSSGSAGIINISGGTITAKGGENGAGIGGGGYDGVGGSGGTVTITGGNIHAVPGKNAEAIGMGRLDRVSDDKTSGTIKDGNGNNLTLQTLTLADATEGTAVTAFGNITYSLYDVKTLEGGKLYFYLPAKPDAETITAGGEEYTCKADLTYHVTHDWSKLDGVCANGCGLTCDHDGKTYGTCEFCGTPLHIHSWTYTAAGNTINAVCTAANCEFTDGNGGSVSIAAPADLTYTGSAIEAAVTDNLKTGDTITVVYSGELTDGYPVNAGAYTASITLGGETISAKYTIVPADGAVTDISNISKTYDGTAVTAPDFDQLGSGAAVIEYKVKGADDSTYTTTAPKDAGEYIVRVAVGADTNYKAASATADFTITKAVPAASDFTFAAPADLTFTGSAKSASFTPAPSITGMGSVTVKYYQGDVEAAPVNAGTYTVKIDVAEGINYTAAYGMTDAAWTFTIAKAEAGYTAPAAKSYLKYNGAAQALVTAGYTEHGTMMYKLDNDQWSSEVPSAVNAGEYTVSYYVAGDENHKDSAEGSVTVSIAKAVPALGTVSAVIEANKTSAAEIVISRSDETVPGKLAIDPAAGNLVWGNNLVGFTFVPDDTANYRTITSGLITVVVTDTAAPTGEVKLETNSWKELVNNVTFGLFFNRNVELEVSAADALSGVKTVEYLAAAEAMTEETVKAAEGWTAVGADGKIGVTAADAEKYVYYIRITDKAGNMAYLSTDGMVFDLTAPVITGVTDGATYYTTQKVQIADANLADGIEAEQTLAGNVEATYEVEAADKAGNTAKVTITMKPISTLSEMIKDLTADNVTGDSTDELAAVKEALAAVDQTYASEAEKQALEAAKANVDALQKVIEDAAEELGKLEDEVETFDSEKLTSDDKASVEELIDNLKEQLNHPNLTEAQKEQVQEVIDKAEEILNKIADDQKTLTDALTDVEDITADGVTAEDSADLAAAKDKLEELKADDNYTEAEKEEIQKEIDRITTLEKVIADTEAEVEALKKEAADLNPDTITSADKEDVEKLISEITAKKSDSNLTEEQKSELDEAIADAQEILDKIAADQQAMTDALTDVKDITDTDVTGDNADELAAAKDKLEELKADDNYTEAEKEEIQKEIDRITALEKVIADTEAEVEALKKEAADLNPDTITSADEAAVEELISEIEAKKSDSNLTEEQKAELDEAIADAQEILEKIAEDQKAMTDALEAVKDVTENDTKSWDNKTLEELKGRLEAAKTALETLAGDSNYTEEEKSAMKDEISRIQNLIKAVEKQITYNNIPEVQKPKVETGEGAEVALSGDGTKAEITVKDGYELEDVLVNGKSMGKVTTLTGLKTGDKVQVLVKKMKSAEEILMGELDGIQLAARSKSTKLNGRKAIKIWWYEADGDNTEFFDGYQVFRSVKRYSGFGKKPFFTTEKTSYINNKDLKSGNTYYYKVRGYVELDGKKYYSDWSKKAWRTF